ncbi:hypothetical protein L227DRAFT_357535 [Lentinus tigrinus ALCF2SS1-6]|uniref:Uncharacterized protein n=1 Tax=Lentinus tigrinus ALCF2SS1-6 TaxID=1328759 RepID=A0A5C2SQ98_9APHY|nr:hypothetical protein L227DRAFT_357535 [Lentinus tigrinus ALCF2SS1-6]
MVATGQQFNLVRQHTNPRVWRGHGQLQPKPYSYGSNRPDRHHRRRPAHPHLALLAEAPRTRTRHTPVSSRGVRRETQALRGRVDGRRARSPCDPLSTRVAPTEAPLHSPALVSGAARLEPMLRQAQESLPVSELQTVQFATFPDGLAGEHVSAARRSPDSNAFPAPQWSEVPG